MAENNPELAELVRLMRILVYPVAKQMLADEFLTDGKLRMDRAKVYAALDGTSQRQVGERTSTSRSTVQRWVLEWRRKGLVDAEGRAVFALGDYLPDFLASMSTQPNRTPNRNSSADPQNDADG